MTPERLNARFAHPAANFREGPGGLCFLTVENEQGSAEISLYGGHVLRFQPAGASPVLWMSETAIFERGTAIRGGIPICWPWFGADPSGAGLPSHGFARLSDWSVESVETVEAGTQVTLGLSDDERSRAQWPHHFKLTLTITVGATLGIELTTMNTGKAAFAITQALHSYFAVDSIQATKVLGLEGAHYIDSLDGWLEKLQSGPIVFEGETDRIYVDTPAECVIDDAGAGRRISIVKSGSRSTVVWNPWTEKAARMKDFPNDAFAGMVCVETTNATTRDTVQLKPSESHSLTASISLR